MYIPFDLLLLCFTDSVSIKFDISRLVDNSYFCQYDEKSVRQKRSFDIIVLFVLSLVICLSSHVLLLPLLLVIHHLYPLIDYVNGYIFYYNFL